MSLDKVRTLLETIRAVAFNLTDKEISDIGIILYGALKRIEKEQEGER